MRPALVAWHVAAFLRHPAFFVAMGLHATLLAAFLILWGDGVPRLPGEDPQQQQHIIQCALLTIGLPWTALRCRSQGTNGGDVVLACMAAAAPIAVVTGRVVATWLALVVVVMSGLPLNVLAQQMAGAPWYSVVTALWPLSAVAALAVASTVRQVGSPVELVGRRILASIGTLLTVAVLAASWSQTWWPLAGWVVALIVLATTIERAAGEARYLQDEAS